MHPRTMARAATWQRPLSQTEIRALHADQAQVPASACAFHALAGPVPSIRTTRAISISFPFTGVTVAFAVNEIVDHRRSETWPKGSAMLIVAELRGMGDGYHLVAIPRDEDDGHYPILGGFDLDASGAVLAGSFWDANLADDDDGGAVHPPEVASRMADIFISRQRDGFDDTTHTDLVREGFSEADIIAHYDEAAGLAKARLRDLDVSDSRATYDRDARILVGANAVAGMLLTDTGAVNTVLHQAGLATREIGNLYPDIIGNALRIVRESRPELAVQ